MTLDTDPIKARADVHAAHQKAMGWSCCRSHASADDVPNLIGEVERLRELLDQRTGDIADRALENAALRAKLASTVEASQLLAEQVRNHAAEAARLRAELENAGRRPINESDSDI